MWQLVLLFILGLILIMKCGDAFVDAAGWIAEKTGVPKFLIGATIVSLATTVPELIVSVMAVAGGEVGLGIGNAVGSVIANLGLVLPVSIICMPFVVARRSFLEKGGLMILATLALWALCADVVLTGTESVLLLLILLLFIYLNIKTLGAHRASCRCETRRERPGKKEVAVNVFKFFTGAAGIVIGARLLVDNGSALAYLAGIDPDVVGLTAVAVGTSLPELVTTVAAVRKGENAMSIGNILGANIIDITLILSVCAFMSRGGLLVGARTISLDAPFALVIMALTVVPTVVKGKFERWQGFVIFGLYLCYVLYMFVPHFAG